MWVCRYKTGRGTGRAGQLGYSSRSCRQQGGMEGGEGEGGGQGRGASQVKLMR